jgi:hypothetical protein
LYDLDLAFLDFWRNTLQWATSGDPPYEGSTDLLRALMRNQEFRTLFLRTMQKHLNSTFQTDRIIGVIDSLQDNIKAQMPRHIERWKGYHGWTYVDPVLGYIETPWLESYSDWIRNVDRFRRFARLRPYYLNGFLMDYFGYPDTVKLKFEMDPPDGGRIWVDHALVIEDDLNATYFKNQTLVIKAIPHPRFRFDGWEILGAQSEPSDPDRKYSLKKQKEKVGAGVKSSQNMVDPQITRQFMENTKLIAHFSYTSEIPVLSVNEVMPGNSGFLPGRLGSYDDWIEIYNPADNEIDVAGLFLTDDQDNVGKWEIPVDDPSATTIPAKGFRIFWADGRPGLGGDHLGFKLERQGEFIGLSLKRSFGFVWIDSLHVPETENNKSYGRFPDGAPDLFFFNQKPTPGSQNIKDPQIPSNEDLLIHPVYPVPFAEVLNVPFDINRKMDLRILVQDIFGNEVIILSDRVFTPGKYKIEWNGRDWAGHGMPAGIYFITFENVLFRECYKTILIK